MLQNKKVLSLAFLAVFVFAFGFAFHQIVIADDQTDEIYIEEQTITTYESNEPVAEREPVDPAEEYTEDKYEEDIVIRTSDGEDFYFSVELALTGEEQAEGLMYRKSMPEMHGMLFVFHSEMERAFWMKNTLIPLDMIFIEKDGRIAHIHHNAQPLDEAHISSGVPVMAVLELNGGMTDKLSIDVGDKVMHRAFKNRHME